MRLIIPALVFTLVSCLAASASFAGGCHGPNAPEVFPDASTASQADMVAAQQSVKQYLTEMESVLKCMETAHLEHAEKAAIEDMKNVAAKFNAVLRSYRARQ